MRRAVLVVVVGALAAAGHASAAPAPLRVTSISPQVADRGELVTIEGGGFGARNLEVTVGGDRVELVSATGSRASFRVPRLGAVGDVTVAARNPGGHVGRIGLTVRFDGSTVAVADAAAAVSVAVGSEGGTIGVAGMSLAIPAGAVPEGTEITATPLRSLRGSPFAAAPVGLKLEPSGLVLLRPATLTLPKPSGPGTLIGFGFNGEGEGFRLLPHRLVGETVELTVWHFSGAGALSARLDELEAVLSYEPTPAHELAEQRIAAALAQGLPPAETEVLIRSALVDWYRHSVRHGLQLANTGPVGEFELAFGEWQAWLAYGSLYSSSSMAVEITEAFGLALVAAGDQAGSILDRCTGSSGLPLTPFRNLARLAAAIELASLPLEQRLAPDGRPLPSGTDLTGACFHVEILSATHATALARNRDNRFQITTEVVFWNGSPRNDLATRFELADATDGPLVPLTNATTSTGSWQTTIRPTVLGERRLDVTAELSTSSSVDLSSTAGSRRFTVLVRERLELHARRAGDVTFTDTIGAIAPGSTVTLRVRLAGDQIAAVPISFTHDGAGSIAASATTSTGGEAFVTYTTSTPGSELVTATVTDGLTVGDAIVITTQSPVAVGVSPTTTALTPGQTRQFTATVTGAANTAVTWTATGGTITQSGLYTAGSTPGTFSVAATSVEDPTKSGAAQITIGAGGRVRVLFRIAQASVSNLDSGAHDNKNFAEEPPLAFGAVSHSAAVSGASANHFSKLLGTSSTLDANGDMNFSASEDHAVSSSTFSVGFRVESAPLRYVLEADTSHSGNPNCATDVILMDGETGVRIVSSGTAPATVSRSGTLNPGTYQLVVGGGCRISGSGGASFAFFLEP